MRAFISTNVALSTQEILSWLSLIHIYKAMDEEYYLLTLMAVARELNIFSVREADVHLAAGLPLTWIRNQHENFRSYLLQNPEVHYRFNNKDYHIHFVGCSLYPL